MGVEEDFSAALAIAAKRADRLDNTSPGTSIVLGLSNMQQTGAPFWRTANYEAAYNANALEVFQDFSSRTEAVYQQVHALGEACARLVAASTEPPIAAKNLAQLEERAQRHPLAPEIRRRRREIELLRWLATVRNKAVQHRAENGYTANAVILLRDAFVLLRKPTPPPATTVRRARATLTGLMRSYGSIQLNPKGGDSEVIAYLDVVAHGLWRDQPGQADPAHRVVREARMHNLVVSAAVLGNIASSFARVLELAEEHPNAVRPALS